MDTSRNTIPHSRNIDGRERHSSRLIRPTSRRFGLLLALVAAAASTLASASAQVEDAKPDEPYRPASAAQRPTLDDELALRQLKDQQEQEALVQAGYDSAERERAALSALGFDADDPVALNVYRTSNDADPGSITAVGDFQLNPLWGDGGLAADRYAGSTSGTYQGIKAAMLSTGETIVVGQVQFSPSGPKNFGLTKRASNGTRTAWTGVDPQYDLFGQYIIYPSTNTSVPSVYSVHDVKVRDDKIYVLYTGYFADVSTYAPAVVCFNADGSDCGWWFAYLGTGTSDGVAMDIYGDRFVVLGRHSLGGSGGFWTWTGGFNSTGGLVDFVLTDFPAPGGIDRSNPADVAFRHMTAVPLGPRPYYVLYTKKFSADISSSDYDPCLLAVNSNNAPDSTFGTDGVRCKPFDESGSSLEDRAMSLTTNAWGTFTDGHEGVQVLVSVARSQDPGFGVWELLDRADHPRFGATTGAAGEHGRGSGRAVYGGCGTRNNSNQGEGCPFLGFSAMHAGRDLANVGNDVVVAGLYYGNGFIIDDGRHYSTLIARIHGDSGELRQFTPFTSGYSEGWFNSLVKRSDTDVIGIGAAIDSSIDTATARTQIMTGLTSVSDRIFADGFD